MPPLRYPFTADALEAAKAELERGTMEDAIRTWLREEGFGLERSEDGQMRLVGTWLDAQAWSRNAWTKHDEALHRWLAAVDGFDIEALNGQGICMAIYMVTATSTEVERVA